MRVVGEPETQDAIAGSAVVIPLEYAVAGAPPATWFIDDLARAMSLTPKRLLAAAKIVGDLPNAQRLGYILDHVGARQLAVPLCRWVDGQSPNNVPLRTGRRARGGSEDDRWHVLIDRPLELEI